MGRAFIVVFALGLIGACAHNPGAASDPKMEHMAQMHTDMAACLRANKTFDECHGKMMAACQQGGPDSCPMMKEHMGGGKMGMMQKVPEPAKPKATPEDEEPLQHHPEGTP